MMTTSAVLATAMTCLPLPLPLKQTHTERIHLLCQNALTNVHYSLKRK